MDADFMAAGTSEWEQRCPALHCPGLCTCLAAAAGAGRGRARPEAPGLARFAREAAARTAASCVDSHGAYPAVPLVPCAGRRRYMPVTCSGMRHSTCRCSIPSTHGSRNGHAGKLLGAFLQAASACCIVGD